MLSWLDEITVDVESVEVQIWGVMVKHIFIRVVCDLRVTGVCHMRLDEVKEVLLNYLVVLENVLRIRKVGILVLKKGTQFMDLHHSSRLVVGERTQDVGFGRANMCVFCLDFTEILVAVENEFLQCLF